MSNNGGVYTWSKTATANASADSTVNYAEGQAPSSLNDSARAAMASVAKYRDDISGMLVTTGTSAAYSLASNQNFDTLADFHGQLIAFTPHVTNAAGPVTMTVDGFANLPLRTAPNAELAAGTLIAGTPYMAIYNNTDASLYLHGYYNNPYNVPFLGGMDYWDTITPNSAFIFPAGQAISRTVYSRAFARWGTKYGAGDGSTTFNVPDKTGRVSAMVEAVATRLTAALGGVDGSGIGNAGGNQSKTLATANLPPYTPAGTATFTGNSMNNILDTLASSSTGGGGFGFNYVSNQSSLTPTGSVTLNMSPQGGTSTPIATLPPLIVCNYIIRIL
jgi:microcystin-dependent protein